MASQTLRLPRGTLKKRTGLAIDIGGSVIKTVFVIPCDDSTDEVHFKNFSSNMMEQALVYLKKNCVLEPGQNVSATGVGIHNFKKEIEDTLHVRISTVMEMSCFATALKMLLEALPESEITYPPSTAAQQVVQNFAQEWLDMIKTVKKRDMHEKPSSSMLKRQEIMSAPILSHNSDAGPYPFLMAMLGSGCAFIKVVENGYSTLDFSTRCGRMFLSLGALLTGEKTYHGLINLARSGDSSKVNVTAAFMKTDTDETNPYNMMVDDMTLYSFGQAMGKDLGDYSKNDLARALLTTICMDVAQAMDLIYHLSGVKSLYVVGSFSDESDLCRDELAICLGMRRTINKATPQSGPFELKFVKNGGYLGALGALISSMD